MNLGLRKLDLQELKINEVKQMPERILIADDQIEVQAMLLDILKSRGAEVEAADDVETALEMVCNSPDGFDLLILDYDFGRGKMNGIEALEQIKKRNSELPVIFLTGKGTIATAVEAMKSGALDFVEKDFYIEEKIEQALLRIDHLIKANLDNKRLRREREFYKDELIGKKYNIVGKSKAISDVISQIEEIASIPRPVLIRGERGTGKELAAAAIHQSSNRKKNPFITINCAALAEGLLECELFGQEDNAFTNSSFREGRFVLADKGTLFLDEICNMSIEFQQKILRVIEYQQFERVGGTKTVKVDVRIIAATNANIETLMNQGKFRDDLYDRLAFETIWMPLLNERKEDIELLSYHFMDQLAAEVAGVKPKKISPEALECLINYDWPGNVRELKYVIERVTYKTDTATIFPHHLPQEIITKSSTITTQGKSLKENLDSVEKQILVDALEQNDWDNRAAAAMLEVELAEFQQLYQKHNLIRET